MLGQHGTCPTCRHPFLPSLHPIDSDDEEESDGGEYVPPDYDTDFETDYEDFLDSDGADSETSEVDGDSDGHGEVPDPGVAEGASGEGEEELSASNLLFRRVCDEHCRRHYFSLKKRTSRLSHF